jgi:cyclic beta-1,2-glucan synthetase
MYFAPEAAKVQILRAAACQFQSGDVLHWWHNLDGEKYGIRSRYRDDPLWLILAACRYAEFTGDLEIFESSICYLDGLPLEPHEIERYAKYERCCSNDTLFEHCAAAFKQCLTFGEHNLPLFGGGDWNDGFNRIGIDGKAESVWLAMFLKYVADEFSALSKKLGHDDMAQKAADVSLNIKTAVETHCWEGDRFVRGFRENKAIGFEKSDSIKIDLLPQAFAVLAGIGTLKQQNTALDTAMELLYDPACGILKLFAPPLGEKDHSIGYTADYPEGVRENGGQYTHGACFFAYALFAAGRADDGWRILRGLVPTLDQFICNQNFFLEPYAIPADISTNPNAYGRGGWSLYTGAAGWYYRTILEKMFGVKKCGDTVSFSPCIPTALNDCKLTLTDEGRKMFVNFLRKGESKVFQDGQETSDVRFKDIDTQIEVWY